MILLNELMSRHVDEDIESSVTMFVNDSFIDVAESELMMEENDVESVSAKV